ncbi:sugar ABC transporter permease [Virgisporangium aliadipatigenens]|uniref:Sugar ABC transporter permease n=1 Tax=Virgisporangium aliadipatigenens TaxID=741659 RepID=A0A8J4DUE6_9ACTN|nr:sugar ABC transporter permease [Virgisporangium aliadipatigenens]GIJ50261.1 sugar ABC transporter permease [Virgisporangium aliadipatigenens]
MRRRKARSETLTFWLFVGPFVAGMLVFVYVPILWSFTLSFFEAQSTVTPSVFVGLDNYVEMLKSGPFRDSLVTFTVFAAFIVPLTVALSLGMAVLVHRLSFARAFFRSAFFIPTACSYVVASLIWKMSIFNGVRFGLANVVLGLFGVENISWLITADPPWYWVPLVTVRLWLQLGFYMILFLAGLQRIPEELYEASYVDGASPGWQTFRHITLPQLRTTTVAVVLLTLIAAYQAFDEFYNLMPSAVNLARTPLQELYLAALSQQDYGRGSAGAMILTLLIMLATLLQGRVLGFGRKD